jgi:hypothetical protein
MVAVIETGRGFRAFGAATPQQVIVWESTSKPWC